ncbi:uncharacterized protein A4U43_C02F10060 [Asparagus officinalis]|uniref:Succinate dehydrogenase subunit 5, mitochondrial n=1 Tax=Asparagus officinalis TaxID=4686 RepID=A0A5P1FM41_ASPOF|nr:succinate dehydrogenase subunit 5, mitochondrial-like [Asparagus officinalis]ONK77741.1 uncharacterized protein A4U43_C02F10060 [Asparagus officinalis]
MAMMLRSLSSSACRRVRSLSSISGISSPAISFSFSAASIRETSPSSAAPRYLSSSSEKGHHIRVFNWGLSLTRSFSAISTTSQLPHITDPDIESAFKDLMAMSWDEIPDSVINNTKKALAKATEDKVGQEALANVFRAAEASVEFGGVLVSLRMALDDLSGLTGENVGPLPGYLEDAMKAAYNRYVKYLDSFGPDEAYLRKKVESELGTKMIHLKMRCSGIGSEWGKVTLLGTSGISGSYVEQRA